jgi:hypothetical protein
MKVIIAGSRSITNYDDVHRAMILSGLWDTYGDKLEVVCGMAPGVDLLGLEFAKRNGLKWYEFPAAWDDIKAPGAFIKYKNGRPYNANAGFDRNTNMAKFSRSLVLVWDGVSTGSQHMYKEAAKYGLFRYKHEPNKPTLFDFFYD